MMSTSKGRLQGKSILISGAAQGIGRASALVRHNHNVVVYIIYNYSIYFAKVYVGRGGGGCMNIKVVCLLLSD